MVGWTCRACPAVYRPACILIHISRSFPAICSPCAVFLRRNARGTVLFLTILHFKSVPAWLFIAKNFVFSHFFAIFARLR